MKIYTTLLFALIGLSLFGQNNNGIKADSNKYTDTVIISLGQMIYLEGEIVNDDYLKLKVVNSISDSSKTIRLEFRNNGGLGNVLTVNNPFSKTLTYKAALYSKKKNIYIVTDVLPVMPNMKGGAMEMWGGKIEKIRLNSFQLTK